MTDNWFQNKMMDPEFRAEYFRERLEQALDNLCALFEHDVISKDDLKRRVNAMFRVRK